MLDPFAHIDRPSKTIGLAYFADRHGIKNCEYQIAPKGAFQFKEALSNMKQAGDHLSNKIAYPPDSNGQPFCRKIYR